MSGIEKSWLRAWGGIGSRAPGNELRDSLVSSYMESARKYHTLQHLTECLALFEAARNIPVHPAEVEIALWFHDAIYDAMRSDNEERSAEWARFELLRAKVQPEVADRIYGLIMATKHSERPVERDEQVLIDIDLGILGSSESRFAEYELQIRAEYAHVPDLLFKSKRRAILQSFMDRPQIYSTAHFHALFEAQARMNLQYALDRNK